MVVGDWHRGLRGRNVHPHGVPDLLDVLATDLTQSVALGRKAGVALLLSDVKTPVIGKQTQLAPGRKEHGAGHHAFAGSEHLGRHLGQSAALLKVIGCDGGDHLAVNLQLPGLGQAAPDGLVIDHDAVVQHSHPVAHHGLVVAQAVGNEPAVAHDDVGLGRRHFVEQKGDGVVGPKDAVAGGGVSDQATGVTATLLGVPDKGLEVAAGDRTCGDDAKDAAHE